MKFKINKKDILDVLSKIQGLTGKKTNLAITESVLIRSTDTGISIIATDLETGFEGFYPAEIEKDGVIAINARKFYEIIRDFPNENILINEVENHWIEIGEGKILYHIVGMNPEDFPESPVFDEVSFIEIGSGVLKRMIENTVVISGPSDEKRAHLIGVLFERKEKDGQKTVRMVSTDGSRLNKDEYIIPDDADFKAVENIIVPKKGLSEVAKFLDRDGVVKIGNKDDKLVIKKDRETIIVRLLEGDFPQYEDVIKKDDKNILEINKKLFNMMLKRMSILVSDEYKSAIFSFKNDNLTITATNPDIGESKEDMVIDFKRDLIETAFNPKYFLDTLGLIDGDTAVIYIKDNESPCLLEGVDNKSFISVIMPMRI